MLIYRVENQRGVGMYKAYAKACYAMVGSDRHPSPNDDAELRPAWHQLLNEGLYRHYNFGFATLDQLRSWIYKDEWREELDRKDFYAMCYYVPDEYMHIGATQAIFRKDKARHIGQFLLPLVGHPTAAQWAEKLEKYNASERKDCHPSPHSPSPVREQDHQPIAGVQSSDAG